MTPEPEQPLLLDDVVEQIKKQYIARALSHIGERELRDNNPLYNVIGVSQILDDWAAMQKRKRFYTAMQYDKMLFQFAPLEVMESDLNNLIYILTKDGFIADADYKIEDNGRYYSIKISGCLGELFA